MSGLPAALRRRPALWAALLLAMAVPAVFGRVAGFSPVPLDDPFALSEEAGRGLTGDGLRLAFTDTRGGMWIPLTWISHMAAVSLLGPGSGAHLMVNVLLHGLAAMALFAAFRGLTGATGPSLAAAALWALHPLRVESVAWLAERKDVLCGLFLFLGLWAYSAYARRGGASRYLLVLGCGAAAMMSKPTAVTFPLLLLILDHWPLRRLGPPGEEGRGARARALILEKIPLLLLLLPMAAAVLALHSSAGIVPPGGEAPGLEVRLGHAAVSLWAYLGLTAWPARLSVLYPFPAGGDPWWSVSLAFAFLVAASWLAWRLRASYPYLLTGWLWFVAALVPVIGIVPLGLVAWADRFTYLPHAGLFLALAWGGWEGVRHHPRWQWAAVASTFVLAAAMATATFVQTGAWRDEATLLRRSLANRGERNWLLDNNLGVALMARGEMEEAERYLRMAREEAPLDHRSRLNLALLLHRQGREAEAEAEWKELLRTWPDDSELRLHRGIVLGEAGRTEEAIGHLLAAAALDPGFPGVDYNLGVALLRLGRWGEAESRFRRALAAREDDPEAHRQLGMLLLGREDFAGGIVELRRALELKPGWEEARRALERATALHGEPAEREGR